MMRALLMKSGGGAGGCVVSVARDPIPVVTLKPTPAGLVTVIVPWALALEIAAQRTMATTSRRKSNLPAFRRGTGPRRDLSCLCRCLGTSQRREHSGDLRNPAGK